MTNVVNLSGAVVENASSVDVRQELLNFVVSAHDAHVAAQAEYAAHPTGVMVVFVDDLGSSTVGHFYDLCTIPDRAASALAALRAQACIHEE